MVKEDARRTLYPSTQYLILFYSATRADIESNIDDVCKLLRSTGIFVEKDLRNIDRIILRVSRKMSKILANLVELRTSGQP